MRTIASRWMSLTQPPQKPTPVSLVRKMTDVPSAVRSAVHASRGRPSSLRIDPSRLTIANPSGGPDGAVGAALDGVLDGAVWLGLANGEPLPPTTGDCDGGRDIDT